MFCDSRPATDALVRHLVASSGRVVDGPLHGGIPEAERRAIVEAFAQRPTGGILVAARVCDAAVDFPDGCLVVQMHIASGSRQQETQRCGRGSREDSTGSHVIHLINAGTSEEAYVERRLAYMREMHGPNLTVTDGGGDDCATAVEVTDAHRAPMRSLTTVSLFPRQSATQRRKRVRALSKA